jgi:hypothetical protein
MTGFTCDVRGELDSVLPSDPDDIRNALIEAFEGTFGAEPTDEELNELENIVASYWQRNFRMSTPADIKLYRGSLDIGVRNVKAN